MRLAWALASVAVLSGCGGGGGGGGDKGPVYTPVSATMDGGLYTLQLGDLKMVVDSTRGARITEFSLAGKNALVLREESSSNYGSTYWPSPQSSWCAAGGGCWPPLAAIDMQAYTGAIDAAANSIQLTSGEAPVGSFAGSAIVVSKQFSPVPEHGAVDVTYTLTNTSPDVSVTLAPWQITRVAAGGLTFFGQGSGDVTYQAATDPSFIVTDGAGDRWYQSALVNHDSKAFADGTGWIAQATPQGLLFVASSPDIQPADAAPGEAEVEVFTNRDFIYVEIEQQGALTPIAPGGSLTWTVRWKLRPVPPGTSMAAGDAGLAALATAVLAD
ncbi:MAG TPA: hypothetical protein VN903_29740 [Polyangia bacterium]|nr:hypothetical protein [Polyangia bacterium]